MHWSFLFQQHKRRLYTCTSSDGQHRNQIDYILFSQRWRSSIQSAKTRLGADCGSDHELLIAKFRLKLKKVGKTTRLFRYDLNQMPNDYTLEVTKLCSALNNPTDCSPPGSSVRGILQARILERAAMPFSRGSSPPRDQTLVLIIFLALAGGFFTLSTTREAQWYGIGSQNKRHLRE